MPWTPSPPETPHGPRRGIRRCGNGAMAYWTCQYCEQRLIEDGKRTNQIKYFTIPSCPRPAATAIDLGNAVTELRRRTIAGPQTPPYP